MNSLKACYRSKGFTLIEVMIGLLIITTAFVGLATVFGSLAKSVLVNKTKTIATNLAQEKIEALKNLSYYRLLVTTASTADSNFPGMVYDIGTTQTYYPEEVLYVGGLMFRRRVYVEYLKQDGNILYGQPWSSNDTGIKKITIFVVWPEEDTWKKVELNNFRHNPSRAQLEYTFSGKVTSGTTNSPLSNAVVDTLQNPSYFSRTDNNGNYSFKVSPGTYTLRATATGYFTNISTSYIVAPDVTGSAAHNFKMGLMGQGTTTGYAYISNHLVITQIVAATEPASALSSGEQEWVELYNPTTYNILIASRSVAGGEFNVFFVTVTYIDDDNAEPVAGGTLSKYLMGVANAAGSDFVAFRSTSSQWSVDTPTISIPSKHFFLIANRSTITYTASNGTVNHRTADAYYYHDTATDGVEIDNNSASDDCGIRVTGQTGYVYNGRTDWHDGVAWYGGGTPSKALEGSQGLDTSGLNLTGYVLARAVVKFYATDDETSMTINMRNGNGYPYMANSFDNDLTGLSIANGGNWILSSMPSFMLSSSSVMNSDGAILTSLGTPAAGASVSSNDGLSSVEYVTDYGSFTLTNMATGTWTITISSGYQICEVAQVTIRASISTGIPNNSTDPLWQLPGLSPPWGYIALTSSTIYGYVSGIVRDALGNPISNASVYTSGSNTVSTNSSGRYRLNVLPSDSFLSIVAQKDGYSTEIVQNVGIALGVNVSTINFTLVSAGAIHGFVTGNGQANGGISGIPIIVYDLSTTTILGSAITRSNGAFSIPSIVTGSYIIAPELESGESSTPPNVSRFVVSNATGTWSSTFTITNAFGEITGSVGIGSVANPITTGVLIVASTSQITTDKPPDINDTVRAGADIYYAVSSDASGRFTLSLRGGTSYYLYGWYPSSLEVLSSSAPKRQVADAAVTPAHTHAVSPGGTTVRNIVW